MTFNSSCPAEVAQAIVVSLPITRKQTIDRHSAMTGLTLPGMIELPGWTAGNVISAKPVIGPDDISRRSSLILIRSTAMRAARRRPRASGASNGSPGRDARRRGACVRSARRGSGPPARCTRLGVEAGAHGRSADVLLGDRIRGGSQAIDPPAKRQRVGGELLAEPNWHGVLHVRAAGLDDIVEFPSLGLEGANELVGSRRESRIRSSVAIRIEVGKTSLVDWAMLTWSLGLTTE